ncbi:MAG TPA: DUF2911 domain-containing protein [Terriglobales bacterium]|nr:DUF2911 domain-containing protein [Terriglobales bacterium]
MRNKILVPAILLILGVTLYAQQDKSKRPSPPGQASVAFADGKKITIDYSRPKTNDPKSGQPRKIFGSLVPYGEVWRTGANEATSFVTEADLMVGSAHVPAGHYTLYTLPQESGWKLIISKKTGQWGTPYPGEADDLARLDMKVQKLTSPVDPFTISLDKTGDKAAVLKMSWENTQASVDITEH